jgi:hypothetical protein
MTPKDVTNLDTEQARDATDKAHKVGAQRGAPLANRNHLRHGLKAGQLPSGAKYIEVRLCKFRQVLEDAVLAVREEVTIVDAALIQTCIRWERHAALAQRWLTKSFDVLKPIERLHFSREIARASAERDKTLRALELDSETSFAVLGQSLSRLALPGPREAHEE